MKYKCYNNAKGMALIIVLFLVGIITIVGLGFIVRGDTELAFGKNMEMKGDMDYLAESGLAHGRGLIMCPQDLPDEPNSYSAQQLESGSSDYYDVSVTKTSELDFQIRSDAYRMQSGSKFATNSLTAKLRLDPAIAFATATNCRLYPSATINGDVYCDGTLENDGTINGDCFVDSLTGTVSGSTNSEAALTLARPAITCSLLTSNFTTQTISSSYLNSTTLSGTPEVYYKDGDLELRRNVKITGGLVVNGNLTITDSGNVITAKKNTPAIFVDGNLILKEGARLTVNGLVFVDGSVDMSVLDQSMTINGVLFTDDGLRYILSDYSGSGYDGVVNGDCAGVTGYLDTAVNFDGSGDFVDIGNPTNLNITSQITVTAFIKTNSTSPTYQGIITKGNSSWRLQKSNGSNNVEFVLSGVTTGSIISKTINLNDGNWHHVAGFYDGGNIAIYVDGVWNNGRPANGNISTNTSSVYIGGNSGASNRDFNGCIDSVRVYNTPLSGLEIAYIAAGGSITHNLVGFWYMNSGSCTTSINASPLKSAVWHWPSGTKDRWTPAAGAFYKSIVRNP